MGWILDLLMKLITLLLPKLPTTVIVGAIMYILGGLSGYFYAKEGCEAEKREAAEAAVQDFVEQSEADQEIIDEGAQANVRIETVYKTITKRVPVIVPGDCGDLGSAYLGVFNDAVDAVGDGVGD